MTITDEQKAANRRAYDRMAKSLQAWRETIERRVEQAQTCQHVYGWVGNVEACQKCGQTKKLAEKVEDEL